MTGAEWYEAFKKSSKRESLFQEGNFEKEEFLLCRKYGRKLVASFGMQHNRWDFSAPVGIWYYKVAESKKASQRMTVIGAVPMNKTELAAFVLCLYTFTVPLDSIEHIVDRASAHTKSWGIDLSKQFTKVLKTVKA